MDGIPPTIETPRLTLVPATVALLEAELDDRRALEHRLGVAVPENWPPEILVGVVPRFLEQLEEQPEAAEGWLAWYVILREDAGTKAVLAGSAGFKGSPTTDGVVEMAYSLLPQYQGRGLATEAAAGLVVWAFGHREVSQVAAEAMAEPNPSRRLLERLGFQCVGEGEVWGTLRFVLSREHYRRLTQSGYPNPANT